MSIKTWIYLGIIYVVVVFGGYSAVTGNNPFESGGMEHDGHNDEEAGHEEDSTHDDHSEEGENMEDAHEHGNDTQSEVTTDVTYNNETVTIALEDETGAPPELEIEHEKEMHFILVSNDLEEYYHLHPEKIEDGEFQAQQSLNDGTYQAFVDIVPEDKTYTPVANELQVGENETDNAHLHSDDEWRREIDGKTVTLEEVNATVDEEVTLNFDMNGETPETHLGALGHVVIIDENAEEYIHVHPASDDETIFNAHFTHPGMYKVWAEFKFDGEIHTYPFVLEVKE